MYLMRKNRYTGAPERVSEHVDTWIGWRNAIKKGKNLGRRGWWINAKGSLYPGDELLPNGQLTPKSKLGPCPFAPPSAPRRPGRPLEDDERMRTVGVSLTPTQIAKAEKAGEGRGVSAGIRELVKNAKV